MKSLFKKEGFLPLEGSKNASSFELGEKIEPSLLAQRHPSQALRFGSFILLLALVLVLSGCGFFRSGPSASGKAAAKTAHRYIGAPYKLGGKSPSGFDCSGLVQYVYDRQGVSLPRSSKQQAKAGRKVKKTQLAKGDLVFFATAKGRQVSHVGIYIGNNKFIHAPGQGKKITTASLNSNYFKRTYHSARRVA